MSAFLAPEQDSVDQLVWSLTYATAMGRVHSLRVPHPLPDPGDIRAIGKYWKRHYNTPQGRGTADEFVQKFEEHVIRTGDA